MTKCIISSFIIYMLIVVNLFGQAQNVFHQEDIIVDGNVFRIKAIESDLFQFVIITDSKRMIRDSFDLVSLNNTAVFLSKLNRSISGLNEKLTHSYKELYKEYEASIIELNDTIRTIENNPIALAEWTMYNSIDSLIKTTAIKLGSLYGCDSLNSVSVNSVNIIELLKGKSENLKSYFESLGSLCSSEEILHQANTKSQTESQALSILDRIRTSHKVDRNDASIAGTLMTNSEVPVISFADSSDKVVSHIAEGANSNLDKTKEIEVNNASIKEIRKKYDLKRAAARRNKKSNIVASFKVDSIQLEFENGSINNIKAVGRVNGDFEIFENPHPITYSTKKGLSSKGFNTLLKSTKSEMILYVLAFDLLYNNYNLLLETENYSPKDQIVTLKPNTHTPIYKEENRKLLQAKVFTDLVGVGEDEPNGIVQLEFSKKVNLVTSAAAQFGKRFSPYFIPFNYVEPQFTVSKIENNQSVLDIDSIPTVRDFGASYSEVLKYRRASFGAELNLYRLGLPFLHSIIDINYGLYYSPITLAMNDVVSESFNSDTLTIVNERQEITRLTRDNGLRFILNVNPSDKYQFSFSYSPRKFKYFQDENNRIPLYEKISNVENSNSTENKNIKYETFEFLAKATLSSSGSLFFRSRYNFLRENKSQQFFQVQLGYSFYFFDKK